MVGDKIGEIGKVLIMKVFYGKEFEEIWIVLKLFWYYI